MQRHARSLRVLLRAWACAQENDRFCTRSYYLPVVNGTSQRIPTVLYAHGNCGSRVHRAEACCTVSVKRSLVSGTFTAFRSWTPSTRYDFSCRSPSPSLHWTSLYAAHAPRLAPRRTRIFECVALATSQPMPIPSVHRGRGSQRAKRSRWAGEPFNSHACTRAHRRAARVPRML